MSEKLCLKWNDFQDNVKSAFGSLREDSDFTDVTLACADGHQIEAHKVVLAASSPFFQDLFKRNKRANQLVYMRGMLYENLSAIVDFLYYGEANVFQENLDSFLSIAEDLKLKGLENVGNGVKEEWAGSLELGQKSDDDLKEKSWTTAKKIPKLDYKAVASPGSGDLNEQVRSLMSKSLNHIRKRNGEQGEGFASICKVCGKEGTGIDIKRHIEANHLEGISLPCNLCDNIFRSRRNLARHKLKQHMHQ